MTPLNDDSDLFDSPAQPKKPSNKIVYQPPGAQWSLSRLPEVESLYKSSFNKPLPLVNRGQGSIHNKWGYDHRNSADVSLNPATPEGQQFVEQLKKAGVPFLAFTGAIPGVATGPHIHLGFPSQRTQAKFNVGAQKKSKTVASDDLFESDDSDLFDRNSEQTLPPTSKQRTVPRGSAIFPALAQSAPSDLTSRPAPPVSAIPDLAPAPTRSLTFAEDRAQRVAAKEAAQRTGMGGLHVLDDPEVARVLRAQQAVRERNPVLAKLRANSLTSSQARHAASRATAERADELQRRQDEPEIQRLTEAYRADIRQQGLPQWLTETLSRGGAGIGEFGVGVGKLFAPILSRDPQAANQRLDALRKHAEAMTRAAVAEGADRNVVSRTIQDATAGFIASTPELAAMTVGAPPTVTFGTGSGIRAIGRGEDTAGVMKATAHGLTTGAAFEVPISSRIRNPLARATTKGATVGGATAALDLASGAPPQQAIASGLTNAAFAGYGELGQARSPSAPERGLVREPVGGMVGPDAKIAARLRGQREPQTETQPNVTPQRAEVESTAQPESVQRTPTRGLGDAGTETASVPAEPTTSTGPQRFYHRDYGEVTEAPSQSKAGKGRVRVIDEQGNEHYVKRADLSGRGNQRMVPLKSENVGEAGGGSESASPSASPWQLRPLVEPETKGVPPNDIASTKVEAQTEPSSKVPEEVRAEPLSEIVTEPVTKSETAVKNAAMEADRVALDLPELAQSEPRKAPEVHQRAIDANAKDPRSVDRLVDAALATEKNFTDVETAQVRLRAQEIKNRVSTLNKELAEAKDPQVIAEKSTEIDSLVNEFDRLSEATKKAGTEWGRAGVARQQAIDQDFSLVSMVARFRRAAKREETPQERAKIEDLSRRNTELEKKLAEAEDRATKASIQRQIDRVSRTRQRTETRQSLDDEFAQLKTQFAQARAETRNIHASGLAGLDPEGRLTKLIGQMAKNRIKAGVTDAAQLVDDVHAAIVEHLPNVDKRMVRDAISGYGITSELSKEQVAKQLRELKSAMRLFSAIEDAQAKQKPLRSGLQRDIDTPEIANLRRQLDAKLREAGFTGPMQGPRLPQQGPRLSDVRKVPEQGPNMSEARSSGIPLQGPKLSDVRRVPIPGPRMSEASQSGQPLQGPKLGDVRKLPAEGPKITDVPMQGPRLSDIRRVPEQGPKMVEHGPPKREFTRDQARRTAIEKQITDLERRMREGDYSKNERQPPRYTRDTYTLQKQLDQVKADYERMKYRATATTGEKIAHTVISTANVPKTLLSMGDVSALLRQGGYGFVTHPILSSKAAVDMVRSIGEQGFANVEAEIKAHPKFEEAKQNGVEFTGVDQPDPRLSKREEGYLGSSAIDTLAKGRLNPLRIVKGIKDVSERTFVSFLDSQRMRMYDVMSDAVRSTKDLTAKEQQAALKSVAAQINDATGRGSLDIGPIKATKAAPVLNVAMFSPRLLASRVHLLNKMFNPVAWAKMPKGARQQIMVDNAKFLGFTALSLGLARAAGASVNLNPNDSEFLKIKVGNTRYDMLAGLQQPMRLFLRMAVYGGGQFGGALRGGDDYSGPTKSKLLGDFARSKAAPEVGYVWDYLEGGNRLTGKKFEAGKDAVKLAIPLPMQDFQEAIQTDGKLRGIIEAMPSLLGVGTQTYISAPNKRAQRIELSEDLRTGRKSAAELEQMVRDGQITESRKQQILKDSKVSAKQARFADYTPSVALDRYERMDAGQREEVREQIEKKAWTLTHSDTLTEAQKDAFQQRLDKLGVIPRGPKSSTGDSFKDLFKQRTASPF